MAISATQMRNYLLEIRAKIAAIKPSKEAKFIARYVGSVGHEDRAPDEQSKLSFLGLSLPQVRELAKSRFSFDSLAVEDQLRIWNELYHGSKIHEELTLALVWMGHKSKRAHLLADAAVVFELQKRVDNWATSDGVSDFVAELLESDFKKYLPRMKKWNRSKNPWERRQSLVGLYCYARMRKKHLPVRESLPLVEALIEDPHYFVQKAVGWCLREIHHVDSRAQMAFVEKHLGRLSSAAFATATEKYAPQDKERLKVRRARERRRSVRPRPGRKLA